jgi:hypothetical protein
MVEFIIIAVFAVLHLAIIQYIKKLRSNVYSRDIFRNHSLYRFLRFNVIGVVAIYLTVLGTILYNYHPLPLIMVGLQWGLLVAFNLMEIRILYLNKRVDIKLYYMAPFLNLINIGLIMAALQRGSV